MEKQIDLIRERNWDTLLLFDACRYDYLEEEYTKFLDGEIRKVRSPSFETSSWLWKTFGDDKHEDIVYISANPYVNERGVQSERFDARNKFHEIINARRVGWDEEYETVLPNTVSRLVRKARMKYPNKRILAHYMQPHYPFLSMGAIKGITSPDSEDEVNIISWLIRKGTVFVQRHLGARGFYLQCLIERMLSIRDPHIIEQIANNYGVDRLREAYRKNLDIVLDSASSLVERLPSNERIIITADHGYLLGEEGYAHMGWNSDLLYEVPWLLVKERTNKSK